MSKDISDSLKKIIDIQEIKNLETNKKLGLDELSIIVVTPMGEYNHCFIVNENDEFLSVLQATPNGDFGIVIPKKFIIDLKVIYFLDKSQVLEQEAEVKPIHNMVSMFG